MQFMVYFTMLSASHTI